MKNERERKRESTKENKERESTTTTTRRCVTEDDVMRAADRLGLSHVEAMKWMDYADEVGWRFSTGAPMTRWNFKRSLRMWRERLKCVHESKLADVEREERRKRREAKKTQRPMTSAERHQAEIEEAERRRDAETKAMAARLKRRV